MKMKSVQSENLFQSLPSRQAGVIQTIYDIVKAHDGELKVEMKEGEGSEFSLFLPNA
jgi:light-regulated signal transduction histidine kinase (bacteriophytochrome)